MTTKMKGLFKGLKNIFGEEEKEEEEIQIGLPTDVKHVAHIGSDGAAETPTWMKDFKAAPTQSAPLPPLPKEESDPKSISEELGRGLSEVARSSRRQQSSELDGGESPKKKDTSSGSRRSRRNRSKKESEGSLKSSRHAQDSGDLQPGNIPSDAPKKSRRKKSKDVGSGSSQRSRTTSSNSEDNDSRSLYSLQIGDEDSSKGRGDL